MKTLFASQIIQLFDYSEQSSVYSVSAKNNPFFLRDAFNVISVIGLYKIQPNSLFSENRFVYVLTREEARCMNEQHFTLH